MNKEAFELQVLVNGRPVKETTFNKDTFIEARRGTQYSLRLKNNTHRRALAVFSVDGIDVLKGKKAEEASGGYVVDSYSTIEVKGFRVDDNTISVFKFDDSDNSYAALIGAKVHNKTHKSSKNCGVIGIKITPEKEDPLPIYIQYPRNLLPFYPSTPRRDEWTLTTNNSTVTSSNDFGGLKANSLSLGTMRSFNNASYACCATEEVTDKSSNFTLGTSWGEKIEDKVETVSFERGTSVIIMSLFYGERHELEALGVDFSPSKKVSGFPKPFGNREYCLIP